MAKKSIRLNTYMNGLLVGTLEKNSNGGLSFSYSSFWIQEHSNFPISRKFPVREQKYQNEETLNYFDNLLPDNKDIRTRLAAKTHSASTGVFDLIHSLGKDCIGALQFQEADLAPPILENAIGEVLSNPEIEKILKNLHKSPLGISGDDEFRLSLAGAQEKTALLYLNKKWQKPLGATATTHILKPQIGILKDGLDMSQSVENEWLCLEFCKAMNLETTNSEMLTFGKTKTLVVERFDREWLKKKLIRKPQEDMCQALGVSPHTKYENQGGPGITAILNLLNESDERDQDRRSFLKAQVVFWLLAAIDGHAKNFSVLLRPRGFSLAPLYDVLSAYPLTYKKQLDERKITLAMCVGKSRHYRINDIQRRHWLETAKLGKFPETEMEKILQEVFAEAPKAIVDLEKRLPAKFPAQISDTIFKGIEKRIKILNI